MSALFTQPQEVAAAATAVAATAKEQHPTGEWSVCSLLVGQVRHRSRIGSGGSITSGAQVARQAERRQTGGQVTSVRQVDINLNLCINKSLTSEFHAQL